MNKLHNFEEYIVGHNGYIRKVSDCTVQALNGKPRMYNAFEVDSFLNDLVRRYNATGGIDELSDTRQ